MADSEAARVGEADGLALIDLHDSDDCLLPSSTEANIADNIARGAISILAVILRILLAAIYYCFLIKDAVKSTDTNSLLHRPPLATGKADSRVAAPINRKVDRAAKLLPSGSNLKTPSKVSLEGAYLQSAPKLSANSTSGRPYSDVDAAQSIQVHHGQGEHDYELCASTEPEECKSDCKFNRRESLDWDSACLNSTGLLDPDELSYIIEKTDLWGKPKHSLPGIEEELSRSTDWISIFESDNLSLERLEADLFCDMRASIQRSSKASRLGNSNGKRAGNVEAKCGRASKTIELPYANTAKPKPASKKLNPGTQGLGKTIKLRSLGAQVNKAVVQSKESISSHRRPPLASGKAGSLLADPTKRLSICASHVKADSIAAGSVSSITKGPYANAMPKTTTSAKILGPSTIKKTGRSSTLISCDTFSSCSLEGSHTSSYTVTKTKVDRTASGSNLKTSSKVSFKAKLQSGSLQFSAYLQSTTKFSSSTSTAKSRVQTCSPSLSSDKSKLGTIATKPAARNAASAASSKLGMQKKDLMRNGSLPHSFSAKPSGLRQPSPKIGFFDGEIAGGDTPGGSLHSLYGLSSFRAKSRAQTSSASLSSNKSKLGTITCKPAARNAASSAHSKLWAEKKDPMKKMVDHPQKGSIFSKKSSSVTAADFCTKTSEGVDRRSSPKLCRK